MRPRSTRPGCERRREHIYLLIRKSGWFGFGDTVRQIGGRHDV